MKAAICIGHSRSGDAGAKSVGEVSEWNYNVPVGEAITDILQASGVQVLLLTSYEGNGYGAAMSWVARELDAFGADCALELHFNSASPSAKGFEHLFWHSSDRGKELAALISEAQAEAFPSSVSRGIKAKDSSDRGSGFLSKPACPAVIAEPFFGSNEEEWERYRSEEAQGRLATVYASAILQFLGAGSVLVPPPEPEAPDETKAEILACVAAAEWQLQKIREKLDT